MLVVAAAVVAVVLGAAMVTSLLPTEIQSAIFHAPILIVVLIVGTGWLLWRISRGPRAEDDAGADGGADRGVDP